MFSLTVLKRDCCTHILSNHIAPLALLDEDGAYKSALDQPHVRAWNAMFGSGASNEAVSYVRLKQSLLENARAGGWSAKAHTEHFVVNTATRFIRHQQRRDVRIEDLEQMMGSDFASVAEWFAEIERQKPGTLCCLVRFDARCSFACDLRARRSPIAVRLKRASLSNSPWPIVVRGGAVEVECDEFAQQVVEYVCTQTSLIDASRDRAWWLLAVNHTIQHIDADGNGFVDEAEFNEMLGVNSLETWLRLVSDNYQRN
jgi:hypothetical protein